MDTPISQFALFLFVATLTSAITRTFGRSNVLPLILVGTILELSPWSTEIITPDLVMVFLIVPLVFGDGITSSFRELRKKAGHLLFLALFPVIISTLIVGAVAHEMAGMTWALAFAVGAILSPTDTVALSSVLNSVPIPREIENIVEGEALLNDVSSLTALNLAISTLISGHVSASDIFLMFTESNLAGVGIGLFSGWIVARALRMTEDDIAINSITLIVPFVVYPLTEHFGGSGILAIVCAALLIGISHQKHASYTGRHYFMAVWEHSAFILQSIAFLLVGFGLPRIIRRLPEEQLMLLPILALAILGALIAVRFFTLFSLRAILRVIRPQVKMPLKDTVLMSWLGVRGPTSSMAALTIPLSLVDGSAVPQRDLAISTAFLVILLTVVLSYTIKPLIKLLKFNRQDDIKQQEAKVWEYVTTHLLEQIESSIKELEGKKNKESELAQLEYIQREYRYRQARFRSFLDPNSRKFSEASLPDTNNLYVFDIMGSSLMQRLIYMQRDLLIHTEWPNEIPDEVIRKALKSTDIQLQFLDESVWLPNESKA